MLRSAVLAFKSFNGQPTGTQSSWLQCWSGPMLLRYFCVMREHRFAEIMFLFHTIPWWSWWRSCFRFEYSKVLDLFDGVFDHEPEGALLCSLETTKDLYMLMKKNHISLLILVGTLQNQQWNREPPVIGSPRGYCSWTPCMTLPCFNRLELNFNGAPTCPFPMFELLPSW